MTFDELMQEVDDQEFEQHQVCSDCNVDLEPEEAATSQNPPHRVLCNPCANSEAIEEYYLSRCRASQDCNCPEGWDTSSGYHDGDVCSK